MLSKDLIRGIMSRKVTYITVYNGKEVSVEWRVGDQGLFGGGMEKRVVVSSTVNRAEPVELRC